MEPTPLENYFNKETFKQSLLKLLIKGANNPGSSTQHNMSTTMMNTLAALQTTVHEGVKIDSPEFAAAKN